MAQAGDRLNRTTSRWSPRQLARRALVGCLPRSRFLESLPGTDAIYLTFDDGPHPEYTPRVLDALQEHGARATFFLIGRECERYPEIVRRIADEGHAIGNHTYSHVSAGDVTSAEWQKDVSRADDALREIIGSETVLFRPPYGKLGMGGMLGMWRQNRTVVLWNVDPKDFACQNVEALRNWFAMHPVEAGDIVLLHDANPFAPVILSELIELAKRRHIRLEGIAGRDAH